MRTSLSTLGVLLALAMPAHAAEQVTVVTPAMLHVQALKPGTRTYLVYSHRKPEEGVRSAYLATSELRRETVDGRDAWVISQSWSGDAGITHTGRSVHDARDLSLLRQTLHWNRKDGSITTTVEPATGKGTLTGEIPAERRARFEAGFARMREGWWFNWHSDLALLPLLPYEKGGTLRLRLFDVGMEAPMEVDYKVVGERTLTGGNGERYTTWLVETDSGSPGSGNFQRFWIDKARRVVVKEEDVFNGAHRSKYLLSVPAVTEFPVGG